MKKNVPALRLVDADEAPDLPELSDELRAAMADSKWLSFIEKRLLLGKRLLRDDGVLIITIDEHEVHHLGMLLEQLFPDSLRSMVTIVNNPKGTGATNFARVEEYAFFVCPSGTEVIERMPFAFAMPTEVAPRDHRVIQAPDDEGAGLVRRLALRRGGAESSNRGDRPRQFYALLIDPETLDVKGIGPELSPTDDPPEVPVDSLVPMYPVDSRGRWPTSPRWLSRTRTYR